MRRTYYTMVQSVCDRDYIRKVNSKEGVAAIKKHVLENYQHLIDTGILVDDIVDHVRKDILKMQVHKAKRKSK
jgi:hypothetical protein